MLFLGFYLFNIRKNMPNIKIFYKVIIVFILVLISILAIRIIIGGEKDTWLCEDGAWIKHGNPEKPMPTIGCGQEIASFEDCVNVGNAVMESYPRQCKTKDGKTFVEYIGNELEKLDLIRIKSPRPNEKINSPLAIKGEARGTWFFEASFPIRLIDSNGNEIITVIAQTGEEWMTEDFISFEATLNFPSPPTSSGRLVLERDNPSGLSGNDDSLIVPVKFK